jgi:hypothetical protein
MSIVQYLVSLDLLLGAWRKLRQTECRLAALAYAQQVHIERERTLWNELSAEDQARLMGWAREHGIRVLHARA